MVGELVSSSAALRFAGGWWFGVLMKQLASLSLAALQARRVMVGRLLQVRPRLVYGRSGLRCIVAVLGARVKWSAFRVVANKI